MPPLAVSCGACKCLLPLLECYLTRRSCVVYLSVLQAAIPRTNRFIVALQSMHTTAVLTEFELAQHSRRSVVNSKGFSSKSSGTTALPTKAIIRKRSQSLSRRSNRSQEPLVEVPLKLTPSADRNFSAYVVSELSPPNDDEQVRQDAAEQGDLDTYRRHVCRETDDHDQNTAAMFSWKSGSSFGDRILRTREVKQEVEWQKRRSQEAGPGASKINK
jgi:hypothetical protein